MWGVVSQPPFIPLSEKLSRSLVCRSCRANFVKVSNSSRSQHPAVKKLCGFEENFEMILESSGTGQHNVIQVRYCGV